LDSEKKRVAIVSKFSLSFGGGGEHWIQKVAQYLTQNGYHVTFFIPDIYKNEKNDDKFEVKYYYSRTVRIFSKLNLLNFAWPFILFNIKEEDYDIVYIPSIYAVRFIFSFRGKILLGTHDYYLPNSIISRDIFLIFPKAIIKALNRGNVFVHAINKVIYEELKKYTQQIILAGTFPFNIPENLRIDEGEKFQVLFMNALNKRKGADLLPAIVTKLNSLGLKDIEFVIIGRIQGKNKSLTSFLSHLPENTKYLGFVSEEVKEMELSRSSLFLFLSSREAAPLSLMEALSYGIPVVSVWKPLSRLIPEYYYHKKICVQADRSYDSIADKVLEFYYKWQSNKSLYKQFKHDISYFSINVFDQAKLLDTTLKMFETLISNGSTKL